MKSVSFICQEGGSNKEYHIQMVPSGDGFVINFQYGAIGSSLKPGTKTPKPIDEAAAEKMLEKLIKERLAKGYTQTHKSYPGDTVSGKAPAFSGPVITEKKTHGVYPQLLNSIAEDEVMKYINDDAYLAQEKKDGRRRMVILGENVIGLNKKGQEVALEDHIKAAFAYVPPKGGVFDGEIIKKLFLFDLLEFDGKDLKNKGYEERLRILEKIKFDSDIEVVKTAYTKAEKLKMYNELKENNAEGIVFKRKDSKHVAGRPNSGGPHLKNKFYKEASFIVKDTTKGKRSVGLELINENGDRVFMGKCTIPPNKEIPDIGAVVEVRYLYAYKGGAIFQPNYKELRDDVDVEECLMTQIIYKEVSDEEEEN